MKSSAEALVGDTLVQSGLRSVTQSYIDIYGSTAKAAVQGFRKPQPMVFAGLYPIDPNNFDSLRTALDKVLLLWLVLIISQGRNTA